MSDGSMRVVEAKLVEKRTFLQWDVAHGTADDRTALKLGLGRSHSSPALLADGCSGIQPMKPGDLNMESDGGSTITDSPMSSPRSWTFPALGSCTGSDNEGYWATDTEDDEDDTLRRTTSYSSWATDAEDDEDARQFTQPMVLKQLCYYIAVPIAAGQNNMLISPQATCTLPATAASQAMQLEARAAELRAQAARLQAETRQGEAVPLTPPAPLPSVVFAPADNQVPNQATTSTPLPQGESVAPQTTLMLRNIPGDYTRTMVVELLDCCGLAGKYNFLYVMTNFETMAGLGSVLVNFVSHADAEIARINLQGFSQWRVQSRNVCEVGWEESFQGLDAHIDRYRNSSLMHQDVPDQYKPIILESGVRVPFPPTTRRVRAPRSKGVLIFSSCGKKRGA